MSRPADPSLTLLNREWSRLAHEPTPAAWPQHPATLGDVLDDIAGDPDARLGELLCRHAGGDDLAGRVVLQSMLGKLVLMAARDPRNSLADYIAECWLQLCRYPLRRRPRRIAANLAMDTRSQVRAAEPAVPCIDPHQIPERCQQVSLDVTGVVRAATRLGLIDAASGACLYAVYGLGLRSHEAARQLRISPELVRWRNARSIRRLTPHAVALAATA